MRLGRESAEARVESMISTLENHSLQNPHVSALFRLIDGTYLQEFAEHNSSALVAGCTPAGFHDHVTVKLKYVLTWKGDPEKVVKEWSSRWKSS